MYIRLENPHIIDELCSVFIYKVYRTFPCHALFALEDDNRDSTYPKLWTDEMQRTFLCLGKLYCLKFSFIFLNLQNFCYLET